ncbi:MAG: radical SAM protein [Candidatus Berkelbacteria bacterium]
MQEHADKISPSSFFIKILGCQYNEWDGARIAYILKNLGLIESSEKDADLIILLNCSVRKTAVDRAMSWVKNWSGKKIILAGCILPDDRPKFLKKGVQIWDGEHLDELAKIIGAKATLLKTTSYPLKTNYIPIMKGCNNFCSYCAVPYTRGREVSRPMADIIADAEKMIASGQKEIVLLGQNVNSYSPSKISVIPSFSSVIPAQAGIHKSTNGSPAPTPPNLPSGRGGSLNLGMTNKKTKNDFAILLKKLNDLSGDFVIKFTSNHPKDMSDDIIEAIASLPKIAKEIHLPFQSGSNKILKAMNRPYTIEQYIALVEKIQRAIPEIILTTDTIVGFPGESEEDFRATAAILKKVDFAQAFNNKYSPREGTAAFALGDPIPWAEKERRWRMLDKISFKK